MLLVSQSQRVIDTRLMLGQEKNDGSTLQETLYRVCYGDDDGSDLRMAAAPQRAMANARVAQVFSANDMRMLLSAMALWDGERSTALWHAVKLPIRGGGAGRYSVVAVNGILGAQRLFEVCALSQGFQVGQCLRVDVVKIKELMGHASIVTTMRYIHATDQGKRGAITVLAEYRKRRRHKFVTSEKRQAVQPAASR